MTDSERFDADPDQNLYIDVDPDSKVSELVKQFSFPFSLKFKHLKCFTQCLSDTIF